MLQDMPDKQQDQHGVDTHTPPDRPALRQESHDGIEECGDEHINANAFQRIINGILFLSHEVGEEHGSGITGEASPGAGHVAVLRHEYDVDREEHEAACG